MADPNTFHFALISNEPTPYRLHLLGRLARELPGATLHSIFTHAVDDPSMPWKMQLDEAIQPVFFPETHLTPGQFGVTASKLFDAITRYVVEHDIRMIVLMGWSDLVRLRLMKWAQQRGVAVFVRGDSNVFSEGRVRGPKRWIKAALMRWVIRHSAGLMPMGTCGRAFFRLYLDHDKPTFLCPYEPDYDAIQTCDEATREAFLAEHELDPNRKRLMYCGRFVSQKRVDVLIDAFAQVADDAEPWDLVLAGDGPLREPLQARVPAALRDRVKWVGFLQFEQTVACYHSCDALVLPSDYEPWALVINEAAAAGVAIIATDVVGAAVELVRPHVNGLLVAPRRVDALAHALRAITDGDTCDAMKTNSPRILADWRAAADPVNSVRDAIEHTQRLASKGAHG